MDAAVRRLEVDWQMKPGRQEGHEAGEDACLLRTNLPAGSPPQWWTQHTQSTEVEAAFRALNGEVCHADGSEAPSLRGPRDVCCLGLKTNQTRFLSALRSTLLKHTEESRTVGIRASVPFHQPVEAVDDTY
jgi:hypothetical protein